MLRVHPQGRVLNEDGLHTYFVTDVQGFRTIGETSSHSAGMMTEMLLGTITLLGGVYQ